MNEIDELRPISDHVLRAAVVQIPQDDLDNLKSIRKVEDETTEVSKTRDVSGSILVAVIDFTTIGLLFQTDSSTLGLLVYTLVTTCLGETASIGMGTLRGTFLVAVNLVKGHTFPTKVKVLPVGFHLYPTELNTLPVGFDPLALVEGFTPVEDNIGAKITWSSLYIPGEIVAAFDV
nr:hypothetical protein [Tanacetum cinerariifolium]